MNWANGELNPTGSVYRTSLNGSYWPESSGGTGHHVPRHAGLVGSQSGPESMPPLVSAGSELRSGPRLEPSGLQEAEPQNSPWAYVGNDMFFALHDVRGKRQAHRRTVNLGLAAALMGELILHHQITIDESGLVHKRQGLPEDQVAAGINSLIQQQRHSSSIKDWLLYIATQDLEGRSVYDHVGLRLADQKLVTVEKGTLRRTRYVPINSNVSGWAWSRVSDSLRRLRQSGDPSRRLIDREALFGNLLLATELHRHVILADGFNVEAELRKQLELTPPAVQRLVHTTENVVGNSAITST